MRRFAGRIRSRQVSAGVVTRSHATMTKTTVSVKEVSLVVGEDDDDE